ncbi:MAG: hypothetical protein GQ533_06635 [Methanosarcinaceae archaeon]|nr:hypothetical protein [Methanosarcinaceae archaeon]
MKIRTNKKILLTSGIGLGLILVGVLAFRFETYSKALFFVGFNLIIIGLIMIITALYAATTKKSKTELVVDERIAGINDKAGNSAFEMVMLSAIVIYWANIIWSFDIELKDLCLVIVCVGIYSNFIFRWHYKR